jgi:guanylate kinase
MEMLKEVNRRGHDIMFITSTYSNAMTARAMYLFDKIDFVHPRNYIMTGRKDVMDVDILFDDCLDHCKNSIAKVPVLVSTPWNKDATGYIRVNGPKEYLSIINKVEQGYTKQDIYRMQNPKARSYPSVIVLVGGSGVGKSTILWEILNQSDKFVKIVTNTTRQIRPGEKDGYDYNFCNEKQFKELIATNTLLEYTEYAGNYYGTSKSTIDAILKSGRNAITIMDIKGVESIKKLYPNNAYAIFLTGNKEDLIRSVLERDVPIEEKVKRCLQLDDDFSSLRKCDYSIENKTIDGTAKEIIDIFT